MIVNPDKFQSIKSEWSWFRHEQKGKINLNINRVEIKSQNSVTLLRVEIDNELNFCNHISNICKKAGNKINAISRFQSFLGQKEKKALVNTFLYSNFNYCSLVWHFSTKKSANKVEKIKSIAYKITLFSIITTLLKHRWSTCKKFAVFYGNQAFKNSCNGNFQNIKWYKPKLHERNLLFISLAHETQEIWPICSLS